jgi:hypothetical protein
MGCKRSDRRRALKLAVGGLPPRGLRQLTGDTGTQNVRRTNGDQSAWEEPLTAMVKRWPTLMVLPRSLLLWRTAATEVLYFNAIE